MGRKRPSLAHQMWERLEEINCIGESRHINKTIDKVLGTKSNKITSYQSYANYKNSSKQFAKWIQENYKEIKYLEQIDKEICKEYIKNREDQGKSAWTYSLDLVTVNKLLDFNITKKDCNVQNRKLENRKNNVNAWNGYSTKDKVIENFISGAGLRRKELNNLKIENCIMQDGELVGIRIFKGAKNGRYRLANVRQEYKALLGSIILSKCGEGKLLDKNIPKRLQCHRIRHEYAKGYLEELKAKGLNREDILNKLTQSMGHNRLDVLKSYGAYF